MEDPRPPVTAELLWANDLQFGGTSGRHWHSMRQDIDFITSYDIRP